MAILVVLWLLVMFNVCEGAPKLTKVITTTTGKVRGTIESSSLPGIKVQKFLNIPYAEPPVGNLRFAKPEPRKPWKGVLNSTDVNIACFQKAIPGWNLTEDCLILNIWTPYPQPRKAAVMVYIHGGSFRSGSSGSKRHRGHNLVAVGNITLVTINYRLSALGFLSTGDERIKGNFGLYDQRLAMKWVKENIANFGGNPDSITLCGLSAGAASVSAHTVSNESWPYFERAILQSGNMLMPWTIPQRNQSKQAVDMFLKATNCSNDENILKCLRNNLTTEHIEKLYYTKPFPLQTTWTPPTVDGEFLKDLPVKLFDSGHVKNSSMIMGITKDEMFYSKPEKLLKVTRNISVITKAFKKELENLEHQFKNASAGFQERLLQLYTPDCIPTFIEAVRPMVDVLSDYAFVCPTKEEAIKRSKMFKFTNVYLYRYSYATPIPYNAYPRGVFGFAAHGVDFLSSFGLTINNPQYPADDQILSMRIILYWTNFVKTGNPNLGTTKLPLVLDGVESLPEWPRHSNTGEEFLDMESLSRMVVGNKLREKQCEFFKNPCEVDLKAKSSASKSIPNVLPKVLTFMYIVSQFLSVNRT